MLTTENRVDNGGRAMIRTPRRVRHRWYRWIAVVVVLGLGVIGVRVGYVYSTYGALGWSVPPAPRRFSFHGHRYVRWDGNPASIAPGYVRLGNAPGGGALFGEPGSMFPPGLEIQLPNGGVVPYGAAPS